MKKTALLITILLLVQFSFAQVVAISVSTAGKGNDIIFLPGFISPGSVWNETAAALVVGWSIRNTIKTEMAVLKEVLRIHEDIIKAD